MFARWQETGAFAVEPDDPGEPFVIAVPPPNVTGSLHMGHALNGSMQDVTVRLRRMQGRKALWICGTDHAGIATQNVVERMLARVNLTREELGREEFVRRVWNWREESRRDDHRPVQAARLLARLRARALHDGRRVRARRDRRVRRAAPARLPLPRQPHGQLVHASAPRRSPISRSSTSRSTTRSTRSTTRSSAAATSPSRPCGRSRCSATPRVAVNPADERYRAPHRPARDRAAGRARGADRRRRARRARRGHRRAQGDARPRPERPRDRAPARARGDRRDRVRRAHDRGGGRALRRADLGGGPEARDRRPARARACCATSSRGATASGTARARATASSRSSRCSGSARWQELAAPAIAAVRDGACASSPRAASASSSTGWSRSGPGASRASSGGAISCRSGTAAAARRSCRPSRRPRCPACGSAELERDPDVLDTWFSSALWPFATLGWPDDTPRHARVLPRPRALHGARHHQPLGRADGHDGHRVHAARGAVPRRRHPPDGARRPTAGACRSRSARASTRST